MRVHRHPSTGCAASSHGLRLIVRGDPSHVPRFSLAPSRYIGCGMAHAHGHKCACAGQGLRVRPSVGARPRRQLVGTGSQFAGHGPGCSACDVRVASAAGSVPSLL